MKRFVSILVLVVSSVRCASIVHGSHQQIPVDSQPPGASVQVTCATGRFNAPPTPSEITLKRNRADCSVSISKDGYHPAEFQLSRQVSGWYFGNILLGGVIGLIVDAADGAMFNQSCGECADHHAIRVVLAPEEKQ